MVVVVVVNINRRPKSCLGQTYQCIGDNCRGVSETRICIRLRIELINRHHLPLTTDSGMLWNVEQKPSAPTITPTRAALSTDRWAFIQQ